MKHIVVLGLDSKSTFPNSPFSISLRSSSYQLDHYYWSKLHQGTLEQCGRFHNIETGINKLAIVFPIFLKSNLTAILALISCNGLLMNPTRIVCNILAINIIFIHSFMTFLSSFSPRRFRDCFPSEVIF